jgi:hypothetical protein
MARTSILAAMNRLAETESRFLATEFLAPVIFGRGVTLSIANVRCTLRVTPPAYRGWGVFRPLSHACAQVVRVATAGERRRYLDLFAAVRLIVVSRAPDSITAIAANAGNSRFEMNGPVTANLAFGCDVFDIVVARFDGSQLWFDAVDPRADPGAAAFLRRELTKRVEPAKVSRPGLSAAHRQAYAMVLDQRMKRLALDRRQREESRLASALSQAGAMLRDFSDTGDSYRVAYIVDGVRHVSVVGKGDLTVMSAGICLSGEDRAFDLNSLVGVLREGTAIGRF